MLKITIPTIEFFDNATNRFLTVQGGDVVLEHSLLSVYKWESKWRKSFLSIKNKTPEESSDYVRCMMVDGNVDPLAFDFIPEKTMKQIDDYINDYPTATTFAPSNSNSKRDIITAEILYWQMTALGIPLEFEHRNLNHLMTLIKVCSIKNSPPKKRSKKETAARYRKANQERRKRYNTKG